VVAILQILERQLTEDQTAVLAAGPLEDLLASMGTVHRASRARGAAESAFQPFAWWGVAEPDTTGDLGTSSEGAGSRMVILSRANNETSFLFQD